MYDDKFSAMLVRFSCVLLLGTLWYLWANYHVEESKKAGLKLNIQHTKVMISGSITSW